jgi:hypothetical protein
VDGLFDIGDVYSQVVRHSGTCLVGRSFSHYSFSKIGRVINFLSAAHARTSATLTGLASFRLRVAATAILKDSRASVESGDDG